MNLDLAQLAALTPIAVIVVQALRAFAWINDRPKVLPFLSIAVGLALSGLYACAWSPQLALPQLVGHVGLHGLVIGLSASGLYSAGAGAVMQKAASIIIATKAGDP